MKIFSWKEPKSIKLNDIVYIYLGSPYSSIMYKCKVKELNIYNDLNDREAYWIGFYKTKEFGLNGTKGNTT